MTLTRRLIWAGVMVLCTVAFFAVMWAAFAWGRDWDWAIGKLVTHALSREKSVERRPFLPAAPRGAGRHDHIEAEPVIPNQRGPAEETPGE